MINLKVSKVNNGYILEVESTHDTEKEVRVYSEDNMQSEKECFSALIYSIAEYCGFIHDKWKTDNLNISWNGVGRKVMETEEAVRPFIGLDQSGFLKQ